jgi:hypothetical protein
MTCTSGIGKTTHFQGDAYDHSVYIEEELPLIIKAMDAKALSMVPEAAKNEKWAVLGSGFTSRRIMKIVFHEFSQIVREKFTHPTYYFEGVIGGILLQKHAHFYNSLISQVQKELVKLGVEETD